ILAMGWFTNILTFGAFINVVHMPKILHASLRFGVTLTVWLVSIFIITSLCVFGNLLTARQDFPAYALISQINLTDFLDRFELLQFFIYFPTIVISSVIIFIAILIALSSFWRIESY